MAAPRLAFLENYDSFSHSLVRLLEELGARCEVFQNDRVQSEDLVRGDFDAYVISPGPCTPAESGVSLAVAELAVHGALDRPLLGVCLGHQAIAMALGARIVRAKAPLHGKTSPIDHDGRGLFAGLPPGLRMARYNSLVVERAPAELEVTATSDGEIMALSHRALPIQSVQFHPESHLSEHGPLLVQNWLRSL